MDLTPEALINEAEAALGDEPRSGDVIALVQARHVRAERLVVRAHIALVRILLAEGDARYQAGREDAARTTCQENSEPERFGVFYSAHLHECSREAEHRSRVHRCACGVEWWLTEGPVIGYRIELDDVGEVVLDPADVTIVRADISLGRSAGGVGDNPEEQQP